MSQAGRGKRPFTRRGSQSPGTIKSSPQKKRLKLSLSARSKSIQQFFTNESSSTNEKADVRKASPAASPNKKGTANTTSSGSQLQARKSNEDECTPFCPVCQMPLSSVTDQSQDQHVSECISIDHTFKPECPDGVSCCSSNSDHYKAFCHFKLAASRSVSSLSSEGSGGFANSSVELKANSTDAPKASSSLEITEFDLKDDDVDDDLFLQIDENDPENKDVVIVAQNESLTSNLKSVVPSSCGNKSNSFSANSQKCNVQKPVFQATITSFFTSKTNANENSSSKPKVVLLKPEEKVKASNSGKTHGLINSAETDKPKKIQTTTSQEVKQSTSDTGFKNTSNFGGKKCPFYKKIPNTAFVVDAFSYGSIPGISCYFLSHFHWDHYNGLTKNFSNHIYCSKVTANLVILKLRVPSKYIHPIPLNESTVIENVEVTLLDANHCPGSVMFLFRFPNGEQILHTGDFRAEAEMELNPFLKAAQISQLYLDTTYCDPEYNFPSQKAVLEYIVSIVARKISKNPKLLIVCGSYTIGKERVFIKIAEKINSKIWADAHKRSVLKCLENDAINSRLTTKSSEAQVHVLSMANLKFKFLKDYLSNFAEAEELMAFKPTGWEYDSNVTDDTLSKIKPSVRGPVTIYGVPYSEHSSFGELERFVKFLYPKKVIPTVGMGNGKSRARINSIINSWLKQ